MRALVVYCHPRPKSYTAAVRDTVIAQLDASGAETCLLDLYARDFKPCLDAAEHERYEDTTANQQGITRDVDALLWCDTLIFVYPTWWYGMPAMLKGWLDRVLVPGVAFLMPDGGQSSIRPGLTHISRLGVFTTCGASWWLTRLIGAPGRRTILRGVRLLCARRCRTSFAAHYRMDSSTSASRARHLDLVANRTDRLIGAPRSEQPVTT